MHISFTIGKTYVDYLAVTLFSLLKYNNNIKVHLIIDFETNDPVLNKIKRLFKKENTLFIYQINNNIFNDLKLTCHFEKQIYYRFLLPHLLPQNLSRIIYSDADVLFIGNIKELWETDLGNNPLGALKNSNEEYNNCEKKHFNSGLLLIDLNKWRNNNYSQKLIDFAKNNVNELFYPDQDALNKVFESNWLELNKKWNLLTCEMNLFFEIKPKIIHFEGAIKPWHPYCPNVFRWLFYWYYFLIFKNFKIFPKENIKYSLLSFFNFMKIYFKWKIVQF